MKKNKKTYEYCPHCTDEVEILIDKPTPCPTCGIEILPCSSCDIVDMVNQCDWNEETRCKKYPTN